MAYKNTVVFIIVFCEILQRCNTDIHSHKDKKGGQFYANINKEPIAQKIEKYNHNTESSKAKLKPKIILSLVELFSNLFIYTHTIEGHNYSNMENTHKGHSIHKRDFYENYNYGINYDYDPRFHGPPSYERFRPPPDRIHERSPHPYHGDFSFHENRFHPPNDRFPPHEYSYRESELHSRPTRGGPPTYYGRPSYNGGHRPPPYGEPWDGPRGGPRPPPHAGPPPHGGPPYGRPPHGGPPHGGPHGGPPHGRPPHEVPPHEKHPHGGPPHGRPPNTGPPQERPEEEATPHRVPSEESLPEYETITQPTNNSNVDRTQPNNNNSPISEQTQPQATAQDDSQTTSRPLYLIQAQPVTPAE